MTKEEEKKGFEANVFYGRSCMFEKQKLSKKTRSKTENIINEIESLFLRLLGLRFRVFEVKEVR